MGEGSLMREGVEIPMKDFRMFVLFVCCLVLFFLVLQLFHAWGNNRAYCEFLTRSEECSFSLWSELCDCYGDVFDPRDFEVVGDGGGVLENVSVRIERFK